MTITECLQFRLSSRIYHRCVLRVNNRAYTIGKLTIISILAKVIQISDNLYLDFKRLPRLKKKFARCLLKIYFFQ